MKKNWITSELLASLQKYIKDYLIEEWENLNIKVQSLKNVNVVTAGLVNAGKSSFLNALIDSFETEIFATGAARTTTQNQYYVYNNYINLIDTPGLDVKQEDEEEAFKAYKEADIILFLHNVKHGELNKAEINFLKQIYNIQKLTYSSVNNKLFFLISWIDEVNDEDLQKIKDVIIKQIDNNLYVTIDVYPISVNRYVTGKLKNKDILIEKSNVLNLKERILHSCDVLKNDKINTINEKLNDLKAKTIKQLKKNVSDLNKQIDDLDQKFYKELEEDLKELDKILTKLVKPKWEVVEKYM